MCLEGTWTSCAVQYVWHCSTTGHDDKPMLRPCNGAWTHRVFNPNDCTSIVHTLNRRTSESCFIEHYISEEGSYTSHSHSEHEICLTAVKYHWAWQVRELFFVWKLTAIGVSLGQQGLLHRVNAGVKLNDKACYSTLGKEKKEMFCFQ